MAKAAKQFGLCIVFLVVMAMQALAQQVSYESAAVGRIVGDSPDEMKRQLTAQDLQLDYASYFGDNSVASIRDTERAKNVISVLEKKFKDSVDAHFVESLTAGRWGWEDVTESLGKWNKGSVLVVEAHGNVEGGMAKAESPAYFDGSLTPLSLDWSLKSGSLAVFDSDFAGARLPKISSFVEVLNDKAVVIAPTAVPDKEFVKVFVCNLGKYGTLGETYRESRNNYYWQTNRPSGIALMSYELYGNPTATVSVPSYDEEQLKELCKGFLKDYTGTAAPASTITVSGLEESFTIVSESSPVSAQQQYTRENALLISDYSVIEAGEYSFLVANGTTLSVQEGNLMLPVAVAAEEFPPKTVITGVRAVAFEEPVEVKVENLPMWYGEPVKRECVSGKENASVDFSNSFTGSKEVVTVAISPVEVVSCSEGKLKLYKKVKYAIDYIPFSPVLIKSVTVQSEAFPGQSIAVSVSLQNLQGAAFEGELVLSSVDSSGELEEHVAEKKVSFAADQQEVTAELAFAAPEEEGIRSYRLEFVQEGEAKTSYEFGIKVKSLELSLTAPATAGESGEATLTITNSLTTPISAVISSYLLKGEETVTATQEKNLEPGPNEVKISYEGLKKEDTSYALLATVNYGSSKETAAATLVTNHPPMIEPVADVTVTEGEKVALNPAAADIDGDEVQISYAGKMESSEWQTNVGDAGSYETTITASDGLLYDTQTVTITVLEDKDVDKDGYEKDVDCNDGNSSISPAAAEVCNGVDDNCNGQVDEDRVCNTAPVLQSIGNKTVSENGLLSFAVAATDNEGDSLTFNATKLPQGAAFDNATAAFTWTPNFAQSGLYAVTFNVSDGLAHDYETINITVANVNRAPRFENVTNQTVLENSTLRFFANATDPDNDIKAVSAEFPVKMAAAAFNAETYEFSWQPTFDDSGNYAVIFAASDGQHSAFAEANITVLNVNVAPSITNVHGSLVVNETENVTLIINASDHDGDALAYSLNDSRFAQDSQSSNTFRWKTGYEDAGTYRVLATASDGSLTTTAAATVKVGNANRAPVLAIIGNKTVSENSTLRFTITASDLDSDPVSITVVKPQAAEGLAFDSSASEVVWTPTFEQAGSYALAVTASDGNLSDSEEINITVLNVNRAPAIMLLLVDPPELIMGEGETKTFSADVSDADNDAVTIAWKVNGKTASTEPQLTITPKYNESGSYNITVIVSDGQAEARAELLVTVLDTMECDLGKQAKLCPLQFGVCTGSNVTCSTAGKWPGCTAATYLGYSSRYEAVESSCDGLDNNCDGSVDEGFGNVDNDNIADCVDDDNDNDGTKDDEDDLIGEGDDIDIKGEDKNVKIEIEEDKDDKGDDKGRKTKTVRINNSGKPLIEFGFNFSKGNILLRNISVEKQNKSGDKGFTLVRGLNLQGGTKQVYVDRLIAGSNAVCVKDKEVLQITEVSSNCDSEGESLLTCKAAGAEPAGSGLACRLTSGNGQYQIFGLKHSAIMEACADADLDSYLPVGCSGGLDCNDNDASINPAAEETCNNIDDNCDSSTDESLQKTEPCGYCGTTTTVCGNGQWLANVTCEGQGPCSQGTEETQSCGYGGKQFRKCSETCAWTQWSECGSQGECQAGDEQEQKCGTTDTGTCELGTQSRTCRQDYYWELWSECSGNIEPAAEVCDGLDNNCNGEADDGLEDLNSDGKCDSPPVMAPVGNRTVKENETLSIALAAYDFNEDKLAFSSSQLPKGASLAEGVFSWTPTFNQAGTYSIEFAVSDGLQQDKESINVTVANANRAPEAKIGLEPPGYYVNEGEFRLLRADVFDPDNDHLEYTWWYLGNADWWQQGKSKFLTEYKSVYFFPNYTDGDGYNTHKFLLNVSDGSATVNATVDLVVVNVQGCKPKDIEKAPCGLAIGACRQGQKNRTCSSDSKWSEWTECVGGVKPQPAEDCGTLEDEDCNGIVNNGCGNSPDLTTTWMSWKLYDTSSGEIPIWSIGNASVTMRPYLYGEVANIGSDDSPPALMAWYLNSRLMARTELPRLNASEKAQVFAYMPYPPYEGVNNISLIVDANSKIREENEKNNQIGFPIEARYNETHKAWAKQYGEDYYLKFPTQEECETQGKCW